MFIDLRARNMHVREKHQLLVAHMRLYWGSNLQLGTCPDLESNLQPFGVRDDTPSQAKAHL